MRGKKIFLIRRSRRKFFKNVSFADKDSMKFLQEPIYHYCKTFFDFITTFRGITNYVSHATTCTIDDNRKIKSNFHVRYPIVISGTSIYDIHILDAKGNNFNISLLPNKIIYYEKGWAEITFFVAKKHTETEGPKFYNYTILYKIK